ncbi:hypothetical protein IJH26_02620 [Candidatus Saccharibacteria bacterium]|nr:hypothetical protein [Candidatus Saccharibacteria bacterium]
MDEKTGGTPNPLNPTPSNAANPQPLSGASSRPVAPRPAARPLTNTTRPAAPVSKPVTPTAPAGATTPAVATAPAETPAPASTVTEQPNPLERPMVQAAEPEVKPAEGKKKTGLIIAGIVALFLAVGCGVAAALIALNASKGDAVSMAMQKLINGETSKNIAIDGTINANIDNDEIPFSNVRLDLNGQTVVGTKLTSMDATLTGKFKGGDEEISLSANEISAENGDIYVKLDGIVDAVETFNADVNTVEPTVEDCLAEEGEEADCTSLEEVQLDTSSSSLSQISQYAVLFELFEDKWFRLSSDDIQDNFNATGSMECFTNLFTDLSTSSNSLAGVYKDHPFISSTTDGISIAKRNNTIYKISVNTEELANFSNDIISLAAFDNFISCTNGSKKQVTASDFDEMFAELPDIYVEIDKDYNFTRLYFGVEDGTSGLSVTADLNFSYPSSVNINEPEEYEDFMEYMEKISAMSNDASQVNQADQMTPALDAE